MTSTYDNTVFDFDLDFLNQPPTNNAEPDLQARCDRLRKSVLFFKKRVKFIDHYVTVAKAAKGEVAELRATETRLKNQCQQHHVEIGNFIEKVTRLENEIQALETQERLKDEKIAELENKIVAQEKVYAQYQVLIEENKLEPIRNDRKKVKPCVTNNTKKTLFEKEVELLRKENAKLLNLDKVNEKLRKENARIPSLEKEIENLRKNNTFISKSEKVNNHTESTRIEQLEKEVATLSKENAKNSSLVKEIEILQKENVRISQLEKEMVNLQKENVKIPHLQKEMVNLRKENTKIQKLEKELVNLQKENVKIPKLEKEIENLLTENAKIPKLEKEIENLQTENARIPKLMKEIENQHKENANFKNSNVKISNLEKDIEILHIKNTEIEIENKSLRKSKIPNEEENETFNSITKENDKLRTKHNKLTREYKLLPNRQDEISDDNEVENDVFEDPLPSPIPNDSFDKKSLIADEDVTELHNSDTDNTPEDLVNYTPSKGGNEEITTDATISRSPTKEIEIPTITIVDHSGNQNIYENNKKSSRRTSHSKLLRTVADDARGLTKGVDTFDNIRSKTRIQEKECLEINNSLRCENHTDLELENIFSTMKLHYDAITPIPKTPTGLPDVNSTSSSNELDEKFDRCSSLCYKTVDFMQLIIKMAISQGRDRNKVNINDCDKMIACFESILKLEQILTETNPGHSVLNKNFNMEMSDCVLVRDGNHLSNKWNPESLTTSLQKETESLQNKKCEERLSQNTSLLQEANQNQSPNKSTNIMIDKQVEKGLPILMHENHDHELTNHSVSEELATDNEISNITDSDGSAHDVSANDVVEVNQPPIIKKTRKNKKKTKLEKLKKKLEPKYKIKMEKTIPENLRKPKQLVPIKRRVTENDTSASLNPKDVYEKAVKFMAQINSKQTAMQAITPPKHTKEVKRPRRHTACLEKDIENSTDNQVLDSVTTRTKRKLSEHFDSCTVVLTKDPLLFSPRKSENSTTHKAKENNNCAINVSEEDENSTTHQAKNINCSTISETEDNNFKTDKATEVMNSTSYRAKGVTISIVDKIKEGNNSITDKAKDVNNSTTDKVKEDIEPSFELPSRKRRRRSSDEPVYIIAINAREDIISTTHKAKENNDSTTHKEKEDDDSKNDKVKENNVCATQKLEQDFEPSDELPLRKRCRRSTNEPDVQYKRVLRSATVHTKLCTEDNIELPKSKGESSRKSIKGPSESENPTQINNESSLHNNKVVSYEDLNVFSENIQFEKKTSTPVKVADTDATTCNPKDSVLCYMIEKHSVETVRPYEKKIPDYVVKQICERIERDIAVITQTHDSKKAMNNSVAELRKLNYKHFVAGLIQFLSKPERKLELFAKVKSNAAPAMTKTEQILLYVIGQLRNYWSSVDIVDAVLCSIEFHLFKLNRTPEFDVIESTSHFYALLCRYVRAKSRLRLFILDAMYCIQFKSVPLIKQCLEVWMNIIPLSHMGMAKSPIVTCLVYLLHFYKCDDKFNRVQEIRKILRDQYFYKITDWNDTKILEMFKNSIKDLKDISIEKKMLRLALIILAKRQGPQWCQNHIVKNILQPMIEKRNVPNNVKEFCVSMMGPLMKPYPVDMKVHCEIAINQLKDILDNNPSPEMEEAAITSMMYINRHDQRSINKTLLSRKMKPMSLALEKSIRDYVKAKSLKVWKKHLSAIAR